MTLAQHPASAGDHLFLDLASGDQPSLRPQRLGQIEHRRQGLRVFVAECPARLDEHALLLLGSALRKFPAAHSSGIPPR
jgi:hypothetical protein